MSFINEGLLGAKIGSAFALSVLGLWKNFIEMQHIICKGKVEAIFTRASVASFFSRDI